jgi:large subunit ribosomal protein L21
MYAILDIGGRQYQVAVGQKIQVNQLDVAVDDEVTLKNVLLLSSEGGVTLDEGALSEATVRAIVTRNFRGPKIRVFKHKRRTGFQKTIGHRQELTELLITDILGGDVSLVKDEPMAEAATAAEPEGPPAAGAGDGQGQAAEAAPEGATETEPQGGAGNEPANEGPSGEPTDTGEEK